MSNGLHLKLPLQLTIFQIIKSANFQTLYATFLIVVIALALIFDYINGFHDAANSIATVVSTKVLTPFQAVVWAAIFNFVAFFIFKDHGVANTVAKTVKQDVVVRTVQEWS